MLANNDAFLSFMQRTAHLNFTEAVQIAGHFNPVAFKKGDLCLKEGQICNHYIFLEEGCMRGFAHDVNGNDISTGFYRANEVVFEVSSFFDRTRSKENIQALSDCRGRAITFDGLNMLFHAMPGFREFGRAILVKGFAGLKARMLSTITETAETRYTALLTSNPDLFKYAQLQHIASYLGVTDSSLSRIRASAKS